MKKSLLFLFSLLLLVVNIAAVNPTTAHAAGTISPPDTALAEAINA